MFEWTAAISSCAKRPWKVIRPWAVWLASLATCCTMAAVAGSGATVWSPYTCRWTVPGGIEATARAATESPLYQTRLAMKPTRNGSPASRGEGGLGPSPSQPVATPCWHIQILWAGIPRPSKACFSVTEATTRLSARRSTSRIQRSRRTREAVSSRSLRHPVGEARADWGTRAAHQLGKGRSRRSSFASRSTSPGLSYTHAIQPTPGGGIVQFLLFGRMSCTRGHRAQKSQSETTEGMLWARQRSMIPVDKWIMWKICTTSGRSFSRTCSKASSASASR